MTLDALQAAMRAAMRGERALDDAAAELGADPARLAIYRRMIRGHVESALRSQLTACVGSLGADDDSAPWQAIFEAYLGAHPPSHWALLEAARDFRAFLHGRIGTDGITAFHACVAEFEWALYEIARDPARLPEPTATPVLNPTLQVLQFPYPVVQFVAAWYGGDRPAVPDPADCMALAFRRPASGHPCFYSATPTLLFALKMVHDGLSVADAVAASGQPAEAVQAALDRGIATGLVIGRS